MNPRKCARKLGQYLKKNFKIDALQGLIIIPLVAGSMILGTKTGIFRSLEWNFTDQFYNLRLEPKESEILRQFVWVTIDEPDIRSVPQWPMTDEVMLKLFQNILKQKPLVVGMDIYRDLPVEPGHQKLKQLFATAPNLFGIEKVLEPIIAPPPDLAKRGQVSASDLLIDRDGNIRRGVVIVSRPNGDVVQGMGTYAALYYLQSKGIELEILDNDRHIYKLGKAKFAPITHDNTIYTDEDLTGYQILLSYLAKTDQFPQISLREVLEHKIPENFLKDKIVFIGSKAPSLNDNYRTPFNNGLVKEQTLMPGVVIHANMALQILDSAINGHPFIQRPAAWIDYTWIVFWVFYGTLSGLSYVQHRWLTLCIVGIGVTIVCIVTYFVFITGWLILFFTPLFSLILASSTSMVASLWTHLNQSYQDLEKQRDLLQNANQTLQLLNAKYSHFVPFEYLKLLQCESVLDLNLGDHTICKIAIMFSDIRDFTSISESMTPQMTFDFVNDYLQIVSPEIRNYGGIVIKFMGDSIMSIFPDKVDHCVDAAIAQQKKLAEYNFDLIERGLKPIRIGIGIHVGNAMLGIIGEKSRMQGDVLSDAVNLASRLEGLTKRYGSGIIMSGDTLLDLEHPDRYHTRLLDQVVVKGRSEPIALFEVLDGEATKIFQLKKVSQTTFERGLVHYFNKELEAAEEHFLRVLKINPNDKTAQIYLDRIRYFHASGMPDNWQGVWHFQDK